MWDLTFNICVYACIVHTLVTFFGFLFASHVFFSAFPPLSLDIVLSRSAMVSGAPVI